MQKIRDCKVKNVDVIFTLALVLAGALTVFITTEVAG